MADTMTHRASIRVGDGGSFIIFDLGFKDGEMEVKLDSVSDPCSLDLIRDIVSFLNDISDIAKTYGGIKSIAVMEKGYHDNKIEYGLTFDDLPETEKAKYKKI